MNLFVMYLLPFLEWSVVSPLMKVIHVLEIPAKQIRVFKTLDFVSTKDACVGNESGWFHCALSSNHFCYGKDYGYKVRNFHVNKENIVPKKQRK